MKPAEIITGRYFPIFAYSETRANLVIVFGLTNIHNSRGQAQEEDLQEAQE